MFKKLLTAGALATVLIAGIGIGTASAEGRTFYCEGSWIQDQNPVGNSMWVVNPYKNFANKFEKYGKKWTFTGPIYNCGNGKWAGHYRS
ncbi:hypothetical protein Xbed_03417 [Xenorhabdus beddingii]|uniref:LCI fold domain-containing protein n=1 Tax=Xenorhabdus beddingii TaxID=40578 RepID=A0A1Y2SFJ2_9GAMM|nr:LCI fold-containing protein [Xenorhabdus beddingii]OTA16754.1 hypothetical protein Xbed_03417 [Xenorhabdus beddingii]